MKICTVGAGLFHDGWTAGQTGMMKLIVTCHNFAKSVQHSTVE